MTLQHDRTHVGRPHPLSVHVSLLRPSAQGQAFAVTDMKE